VIPWALLLFGEIALSPNCRPIHPTYYGFAVIATATVFVVLWANHVRLIRDGAGGLAKLLGAAALNLLQVLFLSAVLAIALWLATLGSIIDCWPRRELVLQAMQAALPVRASVEERFARAGTLKDIGVGLKVRKADGSSRVYVTPDGIVVISVEEFPATVMYEPVIHNGKLQWRCRGLPEKAMPGSCRD